MLFFACAGIIAAFLYASKESILQQFYRYELTTATESTEWAVARALSLGGVTAIGVAEEWYLNMLQRGTEKVQRRAAEGLAEIGSVKALQYVLRHFKDKKPELVTLCTEVQASKAVEVAAQQYKCIVLVILEGMYKGGFDRVVMATIREVLQDPTPGLRLNIICILGDAELERDQIVRICAEYINDEDKVVGQAAVIGIAKQALAEEGGCTEALRWAVVQHENHWSVSAKSVRSYDRQGRPQFSPGGIRTWSIDGAGRVTRIRRGR